MIIQLNYSRNKVYQKEWKSDTKYSHCQSRIPSIDLQKLIMFLVCSLDTEVWKITGKHAENFFFKVEIL